MCFQVWSVSVDGLSGGAVLVLYQDRMASSSKQHGNSIGQEGKCNNQAVEIHDRIVTRWVREGVISNMFNILPIHCDKAGKYNRS